MSRTKVHVVSKGDEYFEFLGEQVIRLGRNPGSWRAFSIVAAEERTNQIVARYLISPSEQELIDCDTSFNNGCNGGLISNDESDEEYCPNLKEDTWRAFLTVAEELIVVRYLYHLPSEQELIECDTSFNNGCNGRPVSNGGLHKEDDYHNLKEEDACGKTKGGYLPDDLTSNDKLFNLFESWMSKFGKMYDSTEEKLHRFEVFKVTVKYIDVVNKEDRSYCLGLNGTSDLTSQEYVRFRCGMPRKPRGPPTVEEFQKRYKEEEERMKKYKWKREGLWNNLSKNK